MSSSPLPSTRTSRSVATEPWWPKVIPRHRAGHRGELSLADYVRLVQRWWWLALGTLLATMTVATAVTWVQEPVYASTATVLIRTDASAQLFPLGGGDLEGRRMAAEADFLASTRYLTEARVAAANALADTPGSPLSDGSVSDGSASDGSLADGRVSIGAEAVADDLVEIEVGDIDARIEPSVITFRARADSPAAAAATAQAWAQAYIDLRHDIDLADMQARISSLTATRDALVAERARVAQPITDLDAEIDRTSDAAALANLSAQRVALLQTLNAQLQPIDTRLASVTTDLAALELKAEFLASPEVSARVNAEATVDLTPVSPQPLRNLALGMVIGSILAMAAVVGVASVDDRLRSTDDVEETTTLGSLAVVPYARPRETEVDLPPGSLVEEAFQRIVSSLDFASAAGRDHQVLLITSPQPGEGKSSTTARLAVALSAQGRRVLVIGGDLRRPTLSTMIGAPDGPGLGDYLTSDDLALESCLHRVEGRRHLVIMPAGQILDGRNPAEVLRGTELASVVGKLREYCDHILIDGPPLLPVVDALELATVADAVVLSLYATRSRRRALERSLRLLDDAGPFPVLGYVLTGVQRPEEGYGGRY